MLQVDLSPLSREALMCFAINLYNTLCIHTLVVHGPDKYNSSVGRVEFFRKVRPAVWGWLAAQSGARADAHTQVLQPWQTLTESS